MSLALTSPSFVEGAFVPARHACTGDNVSPPLAWTGAPAGTRSFAFLCDDPDAPSGTFHHWAVFDIPADRSALPEGLPASGALANGMRQAVNDFGEPGYGGPCPPKGHGVHHYHFRLVALDVASLDLPAGADCPAVAAALGPHILAIAELTGLFER
jgi:Raf kinase inhibitor-like YbhB/YbcL family protein